MHVMLSRVEAVGDVTLTLAAVGWLKQCLPDCKVSMLVSSYSAPVAYSSKYIDKVVLLPPKMEDHELSSFLKSLSITHLVHITANKLISNAAKAAKIPHRYGIIGRFYHWFTCTKLLFMRRGHSGFHESYFNLLLVARSMGIAEPTFDYLRVNYYDLVGFTVLPKDSPLKTSTKKVLLHPFSRGNGREWPLSHYAELAHLLIQNDIVPVLGGILADSIEFEKSKFLFPESCEIIFGQDSLVKYFERISQVDCFVSSSTGPLHIASAMGQKCIGIFPPKKALDIARWGAMGALSRNIVFDKKNMLCESNCSNKNCDCMRSVASSLIFKEVLQLTMPDKSFNESLH